MWKDLCKLSELTSFEEILSDFNTKDKVIFQEIVTKSQPFTKALPEKYQILSFINKLLLYKCLRP